MFDKIIKTVADAIAAAVAREVAKQLPAIAEAVAGAVTDRMLEKLPDFSDVDKQLHSLADLGEQTVDSLVARLRKLPFPFNLL